jgi:hypothetical protein
MTITVPHMYETLGQALENAVKVSASVRKSPNWTKYHALQRVTLADAVYTGDPADLIVVSGGVMIGWAQGFGAYTYEPQRPKTTKKSKENNNAK